MLLKSVLHTRTVPLTKCCGRFVVLSKKSSKSSRVSRRSVENYTSDDGYSVILDDADATRWCIHILYFCLLTSAVESWPGRRKRHYGGDRSIVPCPGAWWVRPRKWPETFCVLALVHVCVCVRDGLLISFISSIIGVLSYYSTYSKRGGNKKWRVRCSCSCDDDDDDGGGGTYEYGTRNRGGVFYFAVVKA